MVAVEKEIAKPDQRGEHNEAWMKQKILQGKTREMNAKTIAVPRRCTRYSMNMTNLAQHYQSQKQQLLAPALLNTGTRASAIPFA